MAMESSTSSVACHKLLQPPLGSSGHAGALGDSAKPLQEKLSYAGVGVVGKGRLELPRFAAHDPKSCSSTNFDTSPRLEYVNCAWLPYDNLRCAGEAHWRIIALSESGFTGFWNLQDSNLHAGYLLILKILILTIHPHSCPVPRGRGRRQIRPLGHLWTGQAIPRLPDLELPDPASDGHE